MSCVANNYSYDAERGMVISRNNKFSPLLPSLSSTTSTTHVKLITVLPVSTPHVYLPHGARAPFPQLHIDQRWYLPFSGTAVCRRVGARRCKVGEGSEGIVLFFELEKGSETVTVMPRKCFDCPLFPVLTVSQSACYC